MYAIAANRIILALNELSVSLAEAETGFIRRFATNVRLALRGWC